MFAFVSSKSFVTFNSHITVNTRARERTNQMPLNQKEKQKKTKSKTKQWRIITTNGTTTRNNIYRLYARFTDNTAELHYNCSSSHCFFSCSLLKNAKKHIQNKTKCESFTHTHKVKERKLCMFVFILILLMPEVSVATALKQ